MSTEVPDGATQRHSRLMDLLTFINLNEGATTTQIQCYMLTTYGLKFRTTSEMIGELSKAGVIKVDGHGIWRLTEKQRTAFKRMVAQEETQNLMKPLLKKIDNIRDPKVRKKALQAYQRLLDILPSNEESTSP